MTGRAATRLSKYRARRAHHSMISEILIQKLTNLKDQLDEKITQLETDLSDPTKKGKLKKITKQKMKKKIGQLENALVEIENLLDRLNALNNTI